MVEEPPYGRNGCLCGSISERGWTISFLCPLHGVRFFRPETPPPEAEAPPKQSA